MAEFATACRYGLPVKVVINNNASLGQILWEQMVLGYPEFGIRFGQRLDFAPWAQACGGNGIRVDKAGDLGAAIAEASPTTGPPWSTSPSTPTSPRCRPRSSTSRRRGS